MSAVAPDAHLFDSDSQRGVAQLRVPPNSIESEQSVLGALLVDNRAWDLVGDLVAEADFYRHEHRLIFVAVGQLLNASKPADVITVYDWLEKSGKGEEVGGLAYLNSLAQFVVGARNARRYAEIVREKAILRRLISRCDEISTLAFNPDGKTVEQIVDGAAQAMIEISPEAVADEWESMDRMVVWQLDDIQARTDGGDERTAASYIPTGIGELDDMLDGGLRGGQFVVIGARPSMGKSALADTIGLHIASNLGLPVGKFSMEMQNSENGQRALSSVGHIPLHKIRRPERLGDLEWSSLTSAVERLRQAPFYSNERAGLNINQIRSKARALHRKCGGLRALFVDYFQLMAGTDPRLPRTYQLEEASRGLKALAKELGIPVIALAQVLRGVEKENDPMPRMSDLKDCGSLEQDADVILFLHRPIVLKPDLGDDWKYYAKGHLAKQRGGRTGTLHFQFDGQYTRYSSWPADTPIPTNPVRTARAL